MATGGRARFVGYGTPDVVVCPPAADVDFTIDCPCDGEIEATINDNNTSRYTHVLAIEAPGMATRTLTVPARTKGSRSKVTWKRGGTVTIWNQNRLAGKNVSARVKVTTINFG